MLALGLHSGFTGKGADLLMIDDPYKNRMEAYSTTTREAIWMWWLQVAKVRITPEANVLLTFHRWHDDDLAGRLIAEGGWEVIRFPAIADDGENDPTGRERGEPLSKRYSIAHLTSIKEADEAGFSALFQGKPVKEGGNIIKEFWWRFWYPADKPAPSPVTITLQDGTVKECEQMPLPALADMDRLIQSWDTNLFESATSDYTVGQAWGKRGALKFLLDQVREHADSPITQQMLIDFSAKHPTIMAKYIEFKAAGVDVYRKLSNVVEGLIKVTPKGEKTMRAHAITPTIQAGNVYLPHPTLFPWVTGLIGECSVFPAGANDDQVDTMTQALSKLTIAEYEEKPEATLTDEERWVRISRRIGAPMPDDAEEDAL
jgi:predicted phage terminase large subunit-like protein